MYKTFACGTLVLTILAPSFSLPAQNRFVSETPRISPFHLEKIERTGNIVQRVMKIGGERTRAFSLAQIAETAWKTDSIYARGLFSTSLENIAPRDADSDREKGQKKQVYRKIVSLIAKRDPDWAKRLVTFSKEQGEEAARTSLKIAEELLDTDATLAADFARRSANVQITGSLVSFLKNLRLKNETEANGIFLSVASRYPTQPGVEAEQFGLLGTYLFRSPYTGADDIQTISYTRAGDVLFPNISLTMPNTRPDLVRGYINGAVSIINRPTDSASERQMRYVLGYLLLPKAREFAPDLVGSLSGAIAARLSSPEIAPYSSDDAFKNFNKSNTGSFDDRLKEIESMGDSYTRDRLYLDLVHKSWRDNDFARAAAVTAKIEDKGVRGDLDTLILFGEANRALKTGQDPLAEAVPLIERLPKSLEKSVLWLAACSKAQKTARPEMVSYSLDMALKSSVQLADENLPYILAFISGELAGGDPVQSVFVMQEAVRAFNRAEKVRGPALVRRITLDPLTLPFSLAPEGLTLDFQKSFGKAIGGNEEECSRVIDDLKDEQLKGDAFVALARSILDKKETPAPVAVTKQGGTVVQVGEDGIRKSAVKTVMPLYPKASLKKKAFGVAVAAVQYNGDGDVVDVKTIESPDEDIGNAVRDAMRQWKFTPSKVDGKPVSIRGKITFYFSIDAKGKGEVKNPKQFQ